MNNKNKICINGQKTSIIYRQGNTPVIVCIHGNSLSKEIFTSLFECEDLKRYGMIAFDLPGHGGSELPFSPGTDFSFSGYGKFVLKLIDYYQLDDYIIFGHSLGGHIALQTEAEYGFPGLSGLFLIGTPPMRYLPDSENAFIHFPPEATLFSDSLTEDGVDLLVRAFSETVEYQKELKGMVISTSPVARINMAVNLGTFGIRNEQELIEKMTVPVSINIGEDDKAINHDYLSEAFFRKLSGTKTVKILPGTDHVPPMGSGSKIAVELKTFLDKCYAC